MLVGLVVLNNIRSMVTSIIWVGDDAVFQLSNITSRM